MEKSSKKAEKGNIMEKSSKKAEKGIYGIYGKIRALNPVGTFIWGPEKTDVLSGKT
ncbi:hypothetical protein T03_13514 [Trichinella britovi]|uniref:Uncharacterized protein n=1 Tax=Trichinella britovi TaxID=45882 RepID=A0A0V1AMG4_TRIBR|nr:hypothetical protein T03_13514 [Trichinella britovi]